MLLFPSFFPPSKIISLRYDIMNFNQLDHEHVAQSWERMKLTIRNCPTHGKVMDDHTNFLCQIEFCIQKYFRFCQGGSFMEITLGEATKLLDNIMANYSQQHTERSSTSKKVHAIEEINTLSGKMDELMKLIASKSAPIDPNDMLCPLLLRIIMNLWM